MTRAAYWAAGLAVWTVTVAGSALGEAPLGLTLSEDGETLLEGRPFAGYGMQYHDCFRRRLRDPEDTSYRQGFETLADRGVPFARFMACGFWPNEMELYLEDKQAYFALLDDIVATAERTGVGLIPSLFWWVACVPDIVGEPVNRWGDPASETHAFMRRYTREVITRYRDSPAIYAWEFGNEYNLKASLPNALEALPWAVPERGTPAERGPEDALSFEDVTTAVQAFAEEARRHDPSRLLFSGHALPRPSEHHQHTEGTWERDSREEFIRHLIASNPAPIDTLTVHLYPEALTQRYFGREDVAFDDLLDACQEAAKRSGKPLFVGEFGAHDDEESGGRKLAREHNQALFDSLLRADVRLASYWVFDFAQQDARINVTPKNHRAYVLDLLENANGRLRERMEKAAAGEVAGEK
jgi:hypothetical protein